MREPELEVVLLSPSGEAPTMPEPDTKSLDALLASLNGSAERFQTLWFSFLGLTLYLIIAARGTTHLDWLLNNSQTLPILNVKVDLLLFYIVAPLLYWVFHFYLLMMLVLLARTAAEFEDELRKTLADEAGRERYRARAENALFLKLLVGMTDERSGINALLLATIALITIVLAPILTLILMQMMFLPYHGLRITWWHRALVIADVGVVLIFWRRFFSASGVENPLLFFRDRPQLRIARAWSGRLVIVCAALWLSFWEGRWAGEPWIGRSRLDWRGGVVWGLFPDRLNLPHEIVVGKDQLEKSQNESDSLGGDPVPTRPFANRNLAAADLRGADLRGVELANADMQGANLTGAALEGANLEGANLRRAFLVAAQWQDAKHHRAKLNGADLSGAQMNFAQLANVQMQGAQLVPLHSDHDSLTG
jgi:hypothetical protein